MNTWAIVILGALLLELGVGVAADVLNLRALDAELPAEVRGVYDPARYRLAQRYLRERTVFGVVVTATQLAVLLGFWAAGGFAWLDAAVRALDVPPVAAGLVFVGALGVARLLVGLPFRWWSTFVIEARYGFNRTTPATFWSDVAKGSVLAVVLGGPLLAAVLWLFDAAGHTAWLWCWLATTLVLVGVQLVAPTWIMPLFNRFTPLPADGLGAAILAYARSVGFPLEGVFVIDGSRRSTKGNAFFTGFGRRKRIALFDTLVETLDPGEVVAVVAHEIGHYKRHHVLTGLVVGIAHVGLVFSLLSLLLAEPGLSRAFGIARPSVAAGLVFAALLLTPLDVVLSVAGHALSRRHEYQADAFAADTTGAGDRLASGLVRLAADTLANLTPHPFYVLLHYSHPPLLHRIHALSSRAPGAPMNST